MAHTALFQLLRHTVVLAHRQILRHQERQPDSFKACLSRRQFVATATLTRRSAIAATAFSDSLYR